ncbi:MAG: hypothetical protein FHK80_07205 [Azoarcus sp. PHD]|nr:MAG: hypothetical protein FHK80_07205 [Azoarcus sp. PHD]
MTLDARVQRLEAAMRTMAGRPTVLFLLNVGEAGFDEQQAEIETMKRQGRTLILLSDGDGAEAWEGRTRVYPVEVLP